MWVEPVWPPSSTFRVSPVAVLLQGRRQRDVLAADQDVHQARAISSLLVDGGAKSAPRT